MTSRVAVFGATRADLFPLQPVIAALAASSDLESHLLVTPAAASPLFGDPLADLDLDRVNIRRVGADVAGMDAASLAADGAQLALEMGQVIDEVAPGCLVVLGDRWELLYAVPPAVLLGVPVVHLHGGEITEGAVDDRIRHAVTKLADLHCTSTHEAARRLRQLGEPDDRLVVTGAPSLDRLALIHPLSDDRLRAMLGFDVVRPLAVVTYHPSTAGGPEPGLGARQVFDAVRESVGSAVITHPGLDPGREAVVAEIDAAVNAWPHLAAVTMLGVNYLPMLATADLMVGNSSSGILEAASFGLPVVDVGDRQFGRTAGVNVLHARENREDIAVAIRTALAPEFRIQARQAVNPYGDGKAAPRIVEVIRRALAGNLARKPFVDHPVGER